MHLKNRLWSLLLTCFVWISTASAEETLSLTQAVNIARANHPALQAAGHDVKAATSVVEAARERINPEITVGHTLIGSLGADTQFSISQSLELNGSRQARVRVATGEAARMAAEAQLVTQELIYNVKLAYWDCVLAQAILNVDNENLQFAQTMLSAAQQLVNLGNQPKVHAMKAEVELARAQQQVMKSEATVAQGKASLNSIMALPATTSSYTPADELVMMLVLLDEKSMLQSALQTRPELNAVLAEVGVAEGNVDVARAATRPDVLLQIQKVEPGVNPGFAVVASLPLFDWGSRRKDRENARETLEARLKSVDNIRNTIRLEVNTALIALRSTEQQIMKFEEQILQLSEKLTEINLIGYREGATNFLDVLEARRTLRDVHLEYYQTIAQQLKEVAQLERVAGIESLPLRPAVSQTQTKVNIGSLAVATVPVTTVPVTLNITPVSAPVAKPVNTVIQSNIVAAPQPQASEKPKKRVVIGP